MEAVSIVAAALPPSCAMALWRFMDIVVTIIFSSKQRNGTGLATYQASGLVLFSSILNYQAKLFEISSLIG